ncbi:ABC transporter permease [Gehongia tenuis]|uniref:ABC transporter permease n=1 Tax=Gehongia tenuis TaxID=2763655 RepID=A0A926D3S4_9FIRM|nr:ABC transporter permease [Gehongia tenuis]MBC8530711.1 ABC transporter permease [Gehongia tenuis]
MSFWDMARMAFHHMRHNFMRSFLTLLGIAIGVASILTVTSVGDGGRARMNRELMRFGINRVWIYPEEDPLTVRSAAALMGLDNVSACCPVARRMGLAEGGEGRCTLQVVGATPAQLEGEELKLVLGRFLKDTDGALRERSAVIMSRTAEALYAGDPIGETLWVDGAAFKVVGVVESGTEPVSKSAAVDQVFLPLSVYETLYPGGSLTEITLSVAEGADVAGVREAAGEMLARQSVKAELKSLDYERGLAEDVLSIFLMVMSFVAAICLVAGGVGVMNIMLVTVSERTHEIGLMKALGADSGMIMVQFLGEALFFSLTGGLIGILGGMGLTALARIFLDIPAAVGFGPALLTALFAAALGLVFGLYPAWKATQLDPVEALGKE